MARSISIQHNGRMCSTLQILEHLDAAIPLYFRSSANKKASQLFIKNHEFYNISLRFGSKLLVSQINSSLARNSSQYQRISFFNNVLQLIKEE